LDHLYEDGNNVGNTTLFSSQNTQLGSIGDGGVCRIDQNMDGNGDGIYTAILQYGTCNTITESGGNITISTTVSGDSNISTDSDHNTTASIHVGRTLEFEAECTFQSDYTVDLQTYVATQGFSAGTVGDGDSGYNSTALNDISFEMTAWLEAMDSIQINQGQPVNIGMPIIIRIESSASIVSNNGFAWYVESCTAGSSPSYDIIKSDNGVTCGSTFLDVYPHDDYDLGTGNQPLMGVSNSTTSTDATGFVMKSFQFANSPSEDFTLTCAIKVCWQCTNQLCDSSNQCNSNGYGCISW
jgi:hypothetical protein